MVLKVISLADISSGDGSYILTQALQPQTWTTFSVVATWPKAKAKRTDWDTCWLCALPICPHKQY
eukprot:4782783-Ditylum_brightwellii.AAC.1